MFPFESYSLKQPRPKKTVNKESIVLSLPIPVLDPENKNLENVSKTLPGKYTALLKDKRVYVHNDWEAKILFNCQKGYFGKGEYSRGEPNLNKESKNEDTELSINYKSLVPISEDKFNNKKEWLNAQNNGSFDDLFRNEFVTSKVKIDVKKSYYKISIDDPIENLYKTTNNPFNYKIKSLPNIFLDEALNLMYEEAFFLVFGLDCLAVCERDEPLNIQTLWKTFYSYDSEFPFKYAVYHKLRSKGWIVKYGIKYGCDFLVYYEGPDRYHASYSVRIKIVDLNTMMDKRIDSFTQFTSLVRINETASKELIFFYAVYDSTKVNLELVGCLSEIKILEIFVNRWVPEANREEAGVSKDINFFDALKAYQDLDD